MLSSIFHLFVQFDHAQYILIYYELYIIIYCNQNVINHVSQRMQYCIHCILHICNIECVIIVTCHNIMNNVSL